MCLPARWNIDRSDCSGSAFARNTVKNVLRGHAMNELHLHGLRSVLDENISAFHRDIISCAQMVLNQSDFVPFFPERKCPLDILGKLGGSDGAARLCSAR